MLLRYNGSTHRSLRHPGPVLIFRKGFGGLAEDQFGVMNSCQYGTASRYFRGEKLLVCFIQRAWTYVFMQKGILTDTPMIVRPGSRGED
jgi:hypothetical protein